MAQTLTYDEILDLAEASHRRIDKKYADDPSYIIRKRVANTATEVIRFVRKLFQINNIPKNKNAEERIILPLRIFYETVTLNVLTVT